MLISVHIYNAFLVGGSILIMYALNFVLSKTLFISVNDSSLTSKHGRCQAALSMTKPKYKGIYFILVSVSLLLGFLLRVGLSSAESIKLIYANSILGKLTDITHLPIWLLLTLALVVLLIILFTLANQGRNWMSETSDKVSEQFCGIADGQGLSGTACRYILDGSINFSKIHRKINIAGVISLALTVLLLFGEMP